MIEPKLIYTPKGGMCATCDHAMRDCSHLDFESMNPICKGARDGTVIVRCSEYVNSGVDELREKHARQMKNAQFVRPGEYS